MNSLLKSLQRRPIPNLQQVRAELARRRYDHYVEYVHHGLYRHARHTRLICDVLQRVEQGELDRVMFTLPPRHGKSYTISETFPSWFIGRKPGRRVIAVSYGDDLARRFGRRNRSKIQEFGRELWGIEPEQGNISVTNWGIADHGGGMLSAGVGGPITGSGADLLLIDDPIKNRQEANSETYKNFLRDEYRNTLSTRLQPGGAIVIVHTRWTEDDLAGWQLSENGDRWYLVNLPCEAEQDDPLGRAIGEPLWPEFGFDAKWMAAQKIESGSYVWAALYQGRPSPIEGGILKRHWWQYYDVLPNGIDRWIQSWDMTFKDAKAAKSGKVDYVVGQVWAQKAANAYLVDEYRAQVDFPDTIKAVRMLTAKWPQAQAKYVEDKANGPAVIATLKGEIHGLIPAGDSSGVAGQVAAVTPTIEAGNVYLPRPNSNGWGWVQDWIEEHAAYPNGAHDDRVAASSQALMKLKQAAPRCRTIALR